MKSKTTNIVILTLLLFPFRLPISIGLTKLFNWIALLSEKDIPTSVLCGNVIITKSVYNLVMVFWLVKTIEMLSREKMGRKAKHIENKGYPDEKIVEDSVYWWSVFIAIIMVGFCAYDGISTYLMFYK